MVRAQGPALFPWIGDAHQTKTHTPLQGSMGVNKQTFSNEVDSAYIKPRGGAAYSYILDHRTSGHIRQAQVVCLRHKQ